MSEPRALEAHLFVCTNRKERGECCAAKGGAELRDELKRLTAQRPEWKGRVRVNAAGCLGHCEDGVAAVLYPRGEWFTKLSPAGAPRLLEVLARELGPGA